MIPLASLVGAALALNEQTATSPLRPCRDVVVAVFDTTVTWPSADSLVQFQIGRPGPEYPADLRSARNGRVVARFVVDTNGRVVKGSAMIVSESHRGFGRSVCQFLAQAQLKSPVVNGRKLTVEVSAAPFTFQYGSRD
ncbi:TonB family protein [Gemmatimonas groenlandica]|uniref:TonB family protein n=1 Tax=Gemmatimonas groenlandica TaxID=2732249 RepID=A0A6M4ISY5_9BACT|nr:TonB family protein [Gemmatimonas groenlandica]QJR37218.1 TonB family protein [Gemmatimonas groenlandica]